MPLSETIFLFCLMIGVVSGAARIVFGSSPSSPTRTQRSATDISNAVGLQLIASDRIVGLMAVLTVFGTIGFTAARLGLQPVWITAAVAAIGSMATILIMRALRVRDAIDRAR